MSELMIFFIQRKSTNNDEDQATTMCKKLKFLMGVRLRVNGRLVARGGGGGGAEWGGFPWILLLPARNNEPNSISGLFEELGLRSADTDKQT